MATALRFSFVKSECGKLLTDLRTAAWWNRRRYRAERHSGFRGCDHSRNRQRTGLPFRPARNYFQAMAGKDAVCFLSGALKTYAVALTKIANDIRWLGSGPRCGIGELKLPATQPGSSIMPGKVNPVIAESLLMVCAQVIGYDASIAWSCAAGNFELNVMMPVMAYDLLQSITLLAAGSRNFDEKCVRGLKADEERATGFVEESLAMCTVLAPVIGYEKAAAIAKKAHETGRTVREVARETAVSRGKIKRTPGPADSGGSASLSRRSKPAYSARGRK